MHVLLVDDSRSLRTIQRSVLAQLGADRVEEACDGPSALRAIATTTPDLMIVDGDIPGVHALKLVKACRAKSDSARILVVTSKINDTLVDEALEAGANAVIEKPFTPDLLSQRIDETMRSAGSPAA